MYYYIQQNDVFNGVIVEDVFREDIYINKFKFQFYQLMIIIVVKLGEIFKIMWKNFK